MGLNYLALLRGINLGGNNKLPMKDLATMFAGAGCEGVQTYIQSGNVIFSAPPDIAEQIPTLITAQIEAQFGFKVPVVLRNTAQVAATLQNNPFLRAGANEDALHVMFLSEITKPGGLAALDPNRSPGDEYIVQGHEIYLHCPNGLARTKLTNAYFDSKLGTISTVRNWRTVTKLYELLTA